MRFTTILLMGLTAVSAGMAAISGRVTNASGETGIAGAAVQMEKGGQKATTDQDGNFTISTGSAVSRGRINGANRHTLQAAISNGRLTINAAPGCPLEVSAFDLRGRELLALRRTIGAGTGSFSFPATKAGLSMYRLRVGGSELVLQAGASRVSRVQTTANGNAVAAKEARAAGTIKDVLMVGRDGYVNYRLAITNSDTSGLAVKMIKSAGTVTDADGNVYQSVKIGTQVWTVQDLKTTRYNDGSAIAYVPDSTAWSNLTTGGFCYFDNDSSLKAKYGALYNNYVVLTGKLAPKGWHVPTDSEWTTLENYLMENGYNWDGSKSGNKMGKAMAAMEDWAPSTSVGAIGNVLSKNNSTGFSALGGGYRKAGGDYGYLNWIGFWWSSTEKDATYAYFRNLHNFLEGTGRTSYEKKCAFSVRIVKD